MSQPPPPPPPARHSPYPLPSALVAQSRFVKLGRNGVPALLAHPDPEWKRPCPTVIWMHGRTVSKELDNGRYLRWIRAGIAACAIDLPGHGERYEIDRQHPAETLGVLAQAIGEIDGVVEALADPAFSGAFDLDRLGIGGMSAGGMVTLRRLCDDHPFMCAAVESTAGNLGLLYGGVRAGLVAAAPAAHAPNRIEPLDPIRHLANWRPIPLLALHSAADLVVPLDCISSFIDAVRNRFPTPPNPAPILHTWDRTGAPDEHSGFGRVAAEAKTRQVEFFTRVFGLSTPTGEGP